MKKGIYTTEFWMTLAAVFLPQIQSIVSQTANSEWNAAFAAAAAGVYTFGRSYAKSKNGGVVPPEGS